MTQKARKNKSIVIGLRTTIEQRAWMTALAAERGITLQALFDEIMSQYRTSSPWIGKDERLLPIPTIAEDAVKKVIAIFRHQDPHHLSMVEGVISGLYKLVLKEQHRHETAGAHLRGSGSKLRAAEAES